MVLAPADPAATAGLPIKASADAPARPAPAAQLQFHIVVAAAEAPREHPAADQVAPPAGGLPDTSAGTDAVRTVVIHAGDTLNSVARANLGPDEPAAIQQLLEANPQLANANLIHPGEVLRIPVASR